MSTILINFMFVVIAIGFIAYIIEKKIRIKRLIAEIEAEPIKYNSNSFSCCSVSNEFISRLILLCLVGVIISVPILYFMNNPYYGMMSLIIIILFLALINFSPYYITIRNNKIYYRHLVDTLNETITIPLSKLEGITYWEETSLKKVLSLNINDFTCIDINVLLMSNYEEIANAINKYIANREKVGNPNTIRYNYKEESTHITELDKRIKVKTSNDYILLMIVLMAIEGVTVFSFFAGYHDIITITAIIVIPLIMLKLLPYKIYFYGDRIEYKHIIHTRNRIETIFLKDISYSEIVTKTLSATTYNNHHRKQNKVKYYTLNIYKKDNDTISLNLLYEKMGDVKQIVDIINSQDIRK